MFFQNECLRAMPGSPKRMQLYRGCKVRCEFLELVLHSMAWGGECQAIDMKAPDGPSFAFS